MRDVARVFSFFTCAYYMILTSVSSRKRKRERRKDPAQLLRRHKSLCTYFSHSASYSIKGSRWWDERKSNEPPRYAMLLDAGSDFFLIKFLTKSSTRRTILRAFFSHPLSFFLSLVSFPPLSSFDLLLLLFSFTPHALFGHSNGKKQWKWGRNNPCGNDH